MDECDISWTLTKRALITTSKHYGPFRILFTVKIILQAIFWLNNKKMCRLKNWLNDTI